MNTCKCVKECLSDREKERERGERRRETGKERDSKVLTRHSGVCTLGQTTPLEPSISPGDDPKHTHTQRSRGTIEYEQTFLQSVSIDCMHQVAGQCSASLADRQRERDMVQD